jgi:hypothetical protein
LISQRNGFFAIPLYPSLTGKNHKIESQTSTKKLLDAVHHKNMQNVWPMAKLVF